MNPFTKHPREVGLGYFQHLWFAITIVGKLIVAVLACFIHAFLPFLFTTTTSSIVTELHGKITHRKSHSE
jgi:hypothetical protein